MGNETEGYANYWDENRNPARLLLEFGADPEAKDNKSQKFLDYATVDAPSVKRFMKRYAKN